MRKTTNVPSPYGPVGVGLVLCDNSNCSNCVQQSLMVGWVKLGYQGTEVRTMGQIPDDMDFCGIACLHEVVKEYSGN